MLMKEESSVSDWLSSVKSLLPITTEVPVHVFLLLAYLLVEENGPGLCSILATTTEIAKVDSSQVRINCKAYSQDLTGSI